MWSIRLFYFYCFFCLICSIGGQEVVTQTSSDYEELRDAFLQANLPQLTDELPSTTLISSDLSISTQPWYNEPPNSQSNTDVTSPDPNSHSTTEYPPYWHNINHNAHHGTTRDPNEVEQPDNTRSTTESPYWLVTEKEPEVHTTTDTPERSTDGVPPTWFNDQTLWNTGYVTTEHTTTLTPTIPDEIENDDGDSGDPADEENKDGEPIGLAEPTAPAKSMFETVEHVIKFSTSTPLQPHTTGLLATVYAEVQFDSVNPTTEGPVGTTSEIGGLNENDLWDALGTTTQRVTDLGESMSDDDEEDKVGIVTTTKAVMNVFSDSITDDAGVWSGNYSTLFNDTFLPGNTSSNSSDGNETLNDFTWNGYNGNYFPDLLNTTERVIDLGESISDDDEEKLENTSGNSPNVSTSTARTYSRRIQPTVLPIHPTTRLTGDFVLESSTVVSSRKDMADIQIMKRDAGCGQMN